jgi:peptidoglycan biosynthesis protein MviN/MurJ (putative lipid II flippase)
LVTQLSKVLFSASVITILAQVLGLLRQSLVVGFFGFSRGLDVYQTAYAIGAVTVFSLNVITESILTSVFSKIREERGESALRHCMGRHLLIALSISIGSAGIFLALFPFVSLLYAAGFSEGDAELLRSLSIDFLPLVLLGIPYFAASAAAKCLWKFGWAFSAELVLMIGSIVFIYFEHDRVGLIAVGYAFGYLVATLFLLSGLFFGGIGFSRNSEFDLRQFLKRATLHYGALQYASLTSVVERIWLSYVPSGGISGLGASQQLIMGLSGVLSFRDAYLVPLAERSNREQRLRGLVLMMAILSATVVAFLLPLAGDVIKILFQYGKVTQADVEMVSKIFSIGLVGMLATAMANPLWRFLQMEGNHRIFMVFYTFTLSSTFLFGWLMVRYFGFGVYGVAFVALANGVVGCAFAFFAIRGTCDLLRLRWFLMLLGTCVVLGVIGMAASYISGMFFTPGFFRALGATAVYVPVVVTLGYLFRTHYWHLVR